MCSGEQVRLVHLDSIGGDRFLFALLPETSMAISSLPSVLC